MPFTTLLNAETLEHHLADPTFVIVDCRFMLDDEDWGGRAYLEARVPGAVFADINRDLSGPKTGTNGRHPLPDPSVLAATLGRLGIDRSRQVVAYDQGGAMYASRLWWLLRWMGHEAVAVLNGGFAHWQAQHLPVESGAPPVRPARVFAGVPRASMIVDVNEAARITHDPRWRLLDARAPERYRGEIEPIDRVPGHIPSARNRPFQSNLDERGLFLPHEQLRDQLQQVIAGIEPDHVVCYCGSGVTACQDLLALEHAGLSGAKLYPGSWSEWSSDPGRPVECGSERADLAAGPS
jgi:thiosulfate/3-mercaptopyruvate sulfurtransferase